MGSITEQNVFVFLVQLFLLLSLAKILGDSFRRWGFPSFTGEILVGIVLGPTIFGRSLPWLHNIIFPQNIVQQDMLSTVAWIGILFLLLQTGLEMDFSSAIRQSRSALVIALSDIVIPMMLSFGVCMFLPPQYLVNPDQRVIFATFMAAAMTISAMAISARALHDLNISKTDLGFLILSALSINDIVGWLIFTVALGLLMQSHVNPLNILLIASSTIIFTILSLTLGRHIVDQASSEIRAKRDEQPTAMLTFVCLLGLFCGAMAHKIGISVLFGFFIAGIMAGSARGLSERTRHVVSQMVHAIFIPLFFAHIGLQIDFLKHFDLSLVCIITAVSMTGKFLGAWIGASLTNTPRTNRLPIAIAHTPGGIMEIVVGLLALQLGLIKESIFIALAFAAITSSIVLGPWLSYAIKRRKEISVLEFFSPRAVIADLSAIERDGAIWELCSFAAEQENILEPHEIYKKVIERENAMGTAMEEGIAIPHARLPFLKKPYIFFSRSLRGIDWNSLDGKPARMIFMIFTPEHEDDVQVQILATIAKVMNSRYIRHQILTAEDRQKIWSTLNSAFTSHTIARA